MEQQAEVEQRAEAAQNFFSARGSDSCSCYGTFAVEKGAWLSSRKNQTKMSGGLEKTDYERLIHPVSQNNPP